MKLQTVILNYKSPDMTLKAAEALIAATDALPDARLTIVDNDSQDGSFEQLRDAVAARPWKSRAEVLQSGHNGGFGAGNNFGIRHNLSGNDPADYFYILNPDAFPQPDAVVKLVDFLDNHSYVGIAGSYIEGPDGVPHHTAFRFPSLISELEAGLGFGPASKLLKDWIVPLPMPERTQQVDWLAGASMMIRRQVLDKIGLFDETFFLYFEETDLCRRSLVAGFPTYYVKDSVVVHIGSASTGMKDKARPMPRFWFDSRKHYFEKHHGPLYLRASNVAWAGGHLLWQVRKVIQRKHDPHPPGLLKDFIKHNFLPGRGPKA
jgi:N-acetylglucosaminyl-diphospho-decaprenol L-rhamnosyltransferase